MAVADWHCIVAAALGAVPWAEEDDEQGLVAALLGPGKYVCICIYIYICIHTFCSIYIL